MFLNHCFALYGKNGIIILEPSSGGSGIKLNTPNPILIEIADDKIYFITFPSVDNKNPTLENLINAP